MLIARMLGLGLARKALPSIGAGLVLAQLGGCVVSQGGWQSDLERRELSMNFEHMAGSAIDIETGNGSIEVIGDASLDSVTVTAEVRARTVERLDATRLIAERDGDGELTLRVHWPEDKRHPNEGASITVRLPDAHGATMKTGNGRVTLENLSGKAEIETSNGRITVNDHDGPVYATTSNGRVELDDIRGEVRVRTSNGRIVATDVAGPADLVTSNGAIEIDLEDGVQGPCTARTSNGSILFETHASMKASLDLSTSNAKIIVQRGDETMQFKGSARVELNGGGPTCTLSTSNGKITVVVDDED